MRARYYGSRTLSSLVAFYNDVTGKVFLYAASKFCFHEKYTYFEFIEIGTV